MCGAVEVMATSKCSAFWRFSLDKKSTTYFASVALVAHLITSNHLRDLRDE